MRGGSDVQRRVTGVDVVTDRSEEVRLGILAARPDVNRTDRKIARRVQPPGNLDGRRGKRSHRRAPRSHRRQTRRAARPSSPPAQIARSGAARAARHLAQVQDANAAACSAFNSPPSSEPRSPTRSTLEGSSEPSITLSNRQEPVAQANSPCHLRPSPGPLAHRVEQGTFNPKVPGSSPGRPTETRRRHRPTSATGLAVDLLADDVGVAGVPRGLGDHDEHDRRGDRGRSPCRVTGAAASPSALMISLLVSQAAR